ncbi:uncharacterized protein YegL [Actinocorallia herbida]|uniref:Uncharacterized protein YegL n=1 Tax=Actinocorallia herbida TaxID=58109 RepID=A0A3N1CUF4_9ACTN|nr:VWA domain-containing protein [Actinocorallia herbida]ROO84834.1 uncharacterized protein YegL [Actinocorallia herbida]
MTDMPGGEMAHRPVHFFWLIDASGSMAVDGKIQQLNFAVREALPEMRRVADDNASAQLLVRAVTFASGARWHVPRPTLVSDFQWPDVSAGGTTDLGDALRLVAAELNTPPMPQRAMKPVLALVSDGQPTDDWQSGLDAVDATPWGKRAVRVAISIGRDCDRGVLRRFLGNPELEPFEANSPKQLAAAIRWASTAVVKSASMPAQGNPAAARSLPQMAPLDDDSDVW